MQFSKLHILRHCLDMKINIEILKNFFREHYDPFFGESFFFATFFLNNTINTVSDETTRASVLNIEQPYHDWLSQEIWARCIEEILCEADLKP